MLRKCFVALSFSFALLKQKYYEPYVYMCTIVSSSYVHCTYLHHQPDGTQAVLSLGFFVPRVVCVMTERFREAEKAGSQPGLNCGQSGLRFPSSCLSHGDRQFFFPQTLQELPEPVAVGSCSVLPAALVGRGLRALALAARQAHEKWG